MASHPNINCINICNSLSQKISMFYINEELTLPFSEKRKEKKNSFMSLLLCEVAETIFFPPPHLKK